MQFLNSIYPKLFIALIAGGLLPLAFAPFHYYPLAIICPALLLATWLNVTPKQATLLGFLFGLGMFGIGTSWVFISINTFGNTSLAISLILTGLMIIYLALYPALQGYFLTRYFAVNSPNKLCLAFSSSWVLLEWVRSWFISGFPWLFLGASQTSSPLRSLLPLIGEYGVSFIVVFTSGILVLIIYNLFAQRFHLTLKSNLAAIFAFLIIWPLAFLLTNKLWTHAEPPAIQVTLVQGNIAQQLKWDPAFLQQTINTYYQLSDAHWDSKIVIWPEAAIPYMMNNANALLTGLAARANSQHSALVTGIPIQDGPNYYNGLIALGNGQGIYYKRHLVPFGEYLPLDFMLRGLINFFNLPMSDFSEGPLHHKPLTAGGITIAPFICYEIGFPNLVLAELPQADVLLTVSDDAWFGQSIALAQHLQIGQTRALETGRYLLFCSNTGLTAIVNPLGKIQAMAQPFVATTLTGTIEKMQGRTPFAVIGPSLIIFLITMLFVLTGWLETNSKSK